MPEVLAMEKPQCSCLSESHLHVSSSKLLQNMVFKKKFPYPNGKERDFYVLSPKSHLLDVVPFW